MAESEGPTGGVGGGPIDGGEAGGGGGARAMLGGSLPPRKRLLAGLKQNGWLAASSGGAPAATVMAGVEGFSLEGGGGGGGGMGAMAAQDGSGGDQVEAMVEPKEGCVSCAVLESPAWRRLKRNGVLHRLCNSCAVLCQKNFNCPLCLSVYPDVKDPAIWVSCSRCQRAVHIECEKKRNPSAIMDFGAYICPECVQAKKLKDMSNGGSVLGTRAKACGGRVGVSCSVEAGICASSAAAECSSPCSKKARMQREVRIIKDADTHEPTIERICSEVKTGLGRKGVSSQEAAAAAAAAAAATACRAAQVAKALAAAKAAAAVKAAAAAKAALDAAALAARAELQARAELRRNSEGKHDAGYLRKEKGEKPEVILEGENGHGGAPAGIDDEELARQLHRAINSSPRISRGVTPLRRKAVPAGSGGKPATESVRAWPRANPVASPTEQRNLPQQQQCAKHQQTRPRSLVGGHKEIKRLDSRVMKKPEHEACQNSAHHQSTMGVLKSEPVDSSTLSHVKQDFPTGHHDYQSAPLDVMKTEGDCQFVGVSEVYSGGDMNHEIRLSDAEVSQAAAMLDEVLMSEEAEQHAAELDEGCLTGYVEGDGTRQLDSHCAGWEVEGGPGMLKHEDGAMAIDAGTDMMTVTIPPGVSELIHLDEISHIESTNTADGVLTTDGQWAVNESDSSQKDFVDVQENANQVAEEGSIQAVKEEVSGKVGKANQELDGSPSQPVAGAAAHRHQGGAKGLSGAGKGFASGGHFSSPPSIPT
ncbi:hypothetical protein MPTK1_4g11490 [Marchantia polymorpha subsp. ruderalis]|uniref:GATA-type domain-containing protein n=2 Tax=Marchantia polymorpha TaxID=3197 RepID=A0AAF6B8U2_MARPO|nr:hypothetical protein MARPO_0011s0134 [Marchantia polymorpha]BBN08426.1 hypothetical protein Mp_4g11490 [Marchantia polymorpha subsp. ruderalis]|eukprot:PTQ46462.1 hypothetical protein MARPO_0011s0134 [Marchantia polymorpha]